MGGHFCCHDMYRSGRLAGFVYMKYCQLKIGVI
nr:MAG TPA: hypothetical protein [Caudoviricetes sp.]